MHNHIVKITLIAIVYICLSCTNPNTTTPKEETQHPIIPTLQDPIVEDHHAMSDLGKLLNQPTITFKLDRVLKEISGMSYDAKNHELVAINDEKGILYRLSPLNGEITDSHRFALNDDYEGIAVYHDNIYTVNSKGQIRDATVKSVTGKKLMKTDLRASNDVEGLAPDTLINSLLIACKGNPAISSKQKIKKTKIIYRYDLNTLTLDTTPYLRITDEQLESHVIRQYENKDVDKDLLKKLRKRSKSFSPSGIAVHPDNDHIYILSSVGKLLVIVDRMAKIHDLVFLDKKVFEQPEGLCFDRDGHLYISSEGRTGKGRIHVFKETE